MDHAFSNRLLCVSLFHGFSRLDFLDLVEKVPLDFRTLKADKHIVKQGEECHALCILLKGEVTAEASSPDHTYRYREQLTAPWVVQPECLFGLHNRYTHTFRALTETQTVWLTKAIVLDLLTHYPAFQINFYNTLSTFAQNTKQQLWQIRRTTEEERFRAFLQRRSLRPAGKKTLHIRMEDLAVELGVTRLRVSQMLARLASQGKLTTSRGVIEIPALETL